jgi:hypothetical protein
MNHVHRRDNLNITRRFNISQLHPKPITKKKGKQQDVKYKTL